MTEQLDLFASSYEKPNLPKHIRIIELFAGIGAQSKGLSIIGADFEHWRTCEWSWQSIMAYNAIHMKTKEDLSSEMTYEEVLNAIRGVSNDYNKPMTDAELRRRGEPWARRLYSAMVGNNNRCPNIMDLHAHDLGLEDIENNTYIMFYSWPCQDLSVAGKLAGYEKGSGTRSGLLWEVERILYECHELDTLPQVLIMENVPQACGAKNLKLWNQWIDVLENLGYTSYYKILNAKDYGIPQNRRRCFMVSILGKCEYSFPKPMELRYRLKDFIEKEVDQSYFLKKEYVEKFRLAERDCDSATNHPIVAGNLGVYGFSQADSVHSTDGISPTILAHLQGQIGHQVNIMVVGTIDAPTFNEMTSRVYSPEGLAPTVRTYCGGGHEAKIVVSEAFHPYYLTNFAIRKLTEGECMRLMGFEAKDTIAMAEAGLSRSAIFHSSGDSIVTTVLAGIFGELLGIEYTDKIESYVDKLHKETNE